MAQAVKSLPMCKSTARKLKDVAERSSGPVGRSPNCQERQKPSCYPGETPCADGLGSGCCAPPNAVCCGNGKCSDAMTTC